MTPTSSKSLPVRARQVSRNPVINLSPVTPEECVPDIHEIEERVRALPDHRRSGRECSTPGCATRIYLSSLGPRCRHCERQAVNGSGDQRDNGTFAHTTQSGVPGSSPAQPPPTIVDQQAHGTQEPDDQRDVLDAVPVDEAIVAVVDPHHDTARGNEHHSAHDRHHQPHDEHRTRVGGAA
jgi:hypothetical protein